MISLVHIFIAWFHRCQFLFLNLNANAFLNVLLLIARRFRINLLLIEFVRLIAEEVRLEQVFKYFFVNEIVTVADFEEEKTFEDQINQNYFRPHHLQSVTDLIESEAH